MWLREAWFNFTPRNSYWWIFQQKPGRGVFKCASCPGRGARLVGALSCAPEGCGFDPWSGRIGSVPRQGVYGRQPIDVSLSLHPPLPLSETSKKVQILGCGLKNTFIQVLLSFSLGV